MTTNDAILQTMKHNASCRIPVLVESNSSPVVNPSQFLFPKLAETRLHNTPRATPARPTRYQGEAKVLLVLINICCLTAST